MFDFFTMQALVREIDDTVLPARVDRVVVTGKTEIAVRLRGRNGRCALILSADPARPHVFVSGRAVQEPKTAVAASRFREHLDSLLRGGAMTRAGIDSAAAAAYDRAARFVLARRDFSGVENRYELIVEPIPHRARILFCDAGARILDVLASPALARRTLAEEGRTPYRPSRRSGTGKLDPAGFDESDFCSRLGGDEAPTPAALTRIFLGFSPAVAAEVILRAGGRWAAVPGAVREILAELEQAPAPTLFREPATGRPFTFFPIPLRSLKDHPRESFDSMNGAADAFFGETGALEQLEAGRRAIFKIVDGRIRRFQKALDKVEAGLERAKQAETLKFYGELLKFHGREEKNGKRTVRCRNYYASDDSEVDVPVDPAFSVRANAAKYFKQYAKAKRGLDASAARAEILKGEIVSWEETRVAAEKAETVVELDEMLAELQGPEARGRRGAAGRRQGRSKGKKSAPGGPLEPREFRSAGFVILVGRSARGNDALSFRMARGDDFWLHAAGTPGSHVVVKNPDRLDRLPEEILEEAAALAAYFSKAGSDEKVDVHFTKRKYIQRAGGGAAGVVQLRKFSTIRVRPRLLTKGREQDG